MKVDLSKFDNSLYDPGRGFVVRILWYFINVLLLQNPLNASSALKIYIIKLFGAKIGDGVVLKPSINIKYPWKLEIGSYSWIGEKVWLDSLEKIKIGNDCCVSQGAYLCTGNHDWSDPVFKLIVMPITLEDGAWVGAHAMVLPGVTVKKNSIISAGSVTSKDTESDMIYVGNPAVSVKRRELRQSCSEARSAKV